MNFQWFTDGSSSGMQKGQIKRAGWAAVVPNLNGKQYIRYGYIPEGTNNMGELTGPLYVLKTFHQKKDWKIEIISDSQYFINSITKWRHNWKLNNYVGIANRELIMDISKYYDIHGHIKLTWVKGHKGNIGNELADKWAGKGKMEIIVSIKNDKQDIQFVPYDLVTPRRLNGNYSQKER